MPPLATMDPRTLQVRSGEDADAGVSVSDTQASSTVPLLEDTSRSRDGDKSFRERLVAPSTTSSDLDIVQFSAAMYFVEANEGHLQVDLMRIGKLRGACKVCYHTEDSSGKAGEQYVARSGEVVFEEGAHLARIDIEILDDPRWNPTLEFHLKLYDPQGCELGIYLKVARVKVIDKTLFPSNGYEEYMGKGEDAVMAIPSIPLYLSYLYLMWRKDGVAWRSCLTLVMDQVKNMYLFLTLTLNIYTVDVVFNLHDRHTEDRLMFFPGDRHSEAIAIGCLIIAPMFLIHVWEHIKIQCIDLKGSVSEYLQCNLFRKYLNYSAESRGLVSAADMFIHITKDSRDLAEGYTIVLDLLRLFGKVGVLTYFTISQNPDAIVWVVVMPALMLVFGLCRAGVLMETARLAGRPEEQFTDFITETCNKYELVADYFQRPKMNEIFQTRCQAFRAAEIPWKVVVNNNEYFTKWLGPVFIGLYTALAAPDVMNGSISLGTFLATLNIFSQISGDFSELFKLLMQAGAIIPPMKELTYCFNLPTDVVNWKAVNRRRREETKIIRSGVDASPRAEGEFVPVEDEMKLRLVKVGFQYPTRVGKSGSSHIFQNVTLTCSQGTIVAIVGPQGAGRNTLMQLLAHKIFPTSGDIMFPSHLRVVHVSQAVFLLNQSVYHNLIFGRGKQADPNRVRQIIKEMNMPKTLKLCEKDIDEHLKEQFAQRQRGDSEEEISQSEEDDVAVGEEGNNPLHQLSWTEKAKIHLARAFIMNPEIMVLQRPFSHHDAEEERDQIWALICKHVKNRGLGLPPETAHRRRPRTVFFVPENEEQAHRADMIWRLREGGRLHEETPDPKLGKPESLSAAQRRVTDLEDQLRRVMVSQHGKLDNAKLPAELMRTNQQLDETRRELELERSKQAALRDRAIQMQRHNLMYQMRTM